MTGVGKVAAIAFLSGAWLVALNPQINRFKAIKAEFDKRPVTDALQLSRPTMHDLDVIESDYQRSRSGVYILHRFPSWEFNDFPSIIKQDRLFRLISDSTPPPGPTWSYTAANHSILSEYELLLNDLLVAARSRTESSNKQKVLDKQIKIARKALENVKREAADHGTGVHRNVQLPDFGIMFSDLPDLSEATVAWRDYIGRPPGSIFSIEDLDQKALLSPTDKRSTLSKEEHVVFQGLAWMKGETARVPAPITIYGAEYHVLSLRRPHWFHTELIREARQAEVGLPRFQRFFGPEGGLSRIPVALVVELDSDMVVEADSAILGATHACDSDDQNIEMETDGGHFKVSLPCKGKIASSDHVVWIVTREPHYTLVGVISEEM